MNKKLIKNFTDTANLLANEVLILKKREKIYLEALIKIKSGKGWIAGASTEAELALKKAKEVE